MNHHLAHYVIGAVALVGAGSAILYKPAPVVIHAPASMADNHARRAAALEWPSLSQSEIDALTVKAKAMELKPILIFCRDNCRDLALDFDDAFESAHLKSQIETPLIDDTVGLMTTSPTLARAIEEATGGRLKVDIFKLVDPRAENSEALVIGRKPQ